MPRPCSLCTHPHRAEIEHAITQGEPYSRIAERYGVSTASISRHRQHLPGFTKQKQPGYETQVTPTVLAELEHAKLEDVSDLKRYLENLNGVVLGVMREALATGRAGTALQAARELRQSLELIAELIYALDRRPTTTVQVSVVQSPEWIELREIIFATLEPYPEIRCKLAQALEAASA